MIIAERLMDRHGIFKGIALIPRECAKDKLSPQAIPAYFRQILYGEVNEPEININSNLLDLCIEDQEAIIEILSLVNSTAVGPVEWKIKGKKSEIKELSTLITAFLSS